MQVGIVGLPNAGKTTLFNALTKAGAEVANYLFTTTSKNVGVAEVPDERLHKIADIVKSQRIIPATIKFVDVAGLVRGASKGEGLGNQFLSYIREADVLVHVVRCFKDENIAHLDGELHPIVDIETVNLELILADLEVVERQIGRVAKHVKAGERKYKEEMEVLERVKDALQRGIPVRNVDLIPERRQILSSLNLLTAKPIIYVANISEEGIPGEGDMLARQVLDQARSDGLEAVVIPAKLEAEIAELPSDEAKTFREEMGLDKSDLGRLIRICYELLGLITFFTTASNECRAWTVKRGTKAPQAAGKVHTDMEKGFIKAEVVSYEDLVRDGSLHAAREHGHLLLEGREYEVRDGDIIYFKFAV
ncbi:MAG: redox-regulated ATPase YchF [Actinomycetota bacterium]|nr:redox-regulated ATPase YchF [Actinomycetota bacterium]